MVGRKVVILGSAIPAVALFAHGCRTPAQVTLDVTTGVVCAESRGVDIVVAGSAHDAEERAVLLTPGTRFPTATTTDCASETTPHHVGTLVITPGGSGGAVVVIAAFGSTKVDTCKLGSFSAECIVARRSFSFVDHEKVTLPVLLDPDCAGIPCNESSTCVGKKCVDSHVTCESGTCSDPGQVVPGEVDGSSPLLDGASTPPPPPPGPLSDAGDDAADASDGGGVMDATSDGPLPPGTCACLDGTVCTGGKTCCYESGTLSCKLSVDCANGISACCRDSQDCQSATDVCCMNTTSPMPGSQIACVPATSCYPPPIPPPTVKAVCRADGPAGCGVGHSCIGSAWTPPLPAFFDCS